MKGISVLILLSLFICTLGIPNGNPRWGIKEVQGERPYVENSRKQLTPDQKRENNVELTSEERTERLMQRLLAISRMFSDRGNEVDNLRKGGKSDDSEESSSSSDSSSSEEKHNKKGLQHDKKSTNKSKKSENSKDDSSSESSSSSSSSEDSNSKKYESKWNKKKPEKQNKDSNQNRDKNPPGKASTSSVIPEAQGQNGSHDTGYLSTITPSVNNGITSQNPKPEGTSTSEDREANVDSKITSESPLSTLESAQGVTQSGWQSSIPGKEIPTTLPESVTKPEAGNIISQTTKQVEESPNQTTEQLPTINVPDDIQLQNNKTNEDEKSTVSSLTTDAGNDPKLETYASIPTSIPNHGVTRKIVKRSDPGSKRNDEEAKPIPAQVPTGQNNGGLTNQQPSVVGGILHTLVSAGDSINPFNIGGLSGKGSLGVDGNRQPSVVAGILHKFVSSADAINPFKSHGTNYNADNIIFPDQLPAKNQLETYVEKIGVPQQGSLVSNEMLQKPIEVGTSNEKAVQEIPTGIPTSATTPMTSSTLKPTLTSTTLRPTSTFAPITTSIPEDNTTLGTTEKNDRPFINFLNFLHTFKQQLKPGFNITIPVTDVNAEVGTPQGLFSRIIKRIQQLLYGA